MFGSALWYLYVTVIVVFAAAAIVSTQYKRFEASGEATFVGASFLTYMHDIVLYLYKYLYRVYVYYLLTLD